MLLRCTKPGLKYNRRVIEVGDEFDTLNDRDGKVLLATKKAVRSEERKPVRLAPPPAATLKKLEGATAGASKEPPPAAANAAGNTSEVPKVEISAEWESLHWTQQVKIAEALNGGELVPAEGETKAQKAHGIIKAEMEKRAAAASQA